MSKIQQDGWPDRHGGKTRKLREHVVAPEPPAPQELEPSRPLELPEPPATVRRGGAKRDR